MKKSKIVALVVITGLIFACNKKSENNNNITDSVNQILSSPTLWKDVKSGMSFDEVKKLYPSSEIVTEEDAPDNFISLQFDGVVVQKENFLVEFLFDDNKLNTVSLYPKNDIRNAIADRLFAGIEEELTLKYGNPVDETSNRISLSYRLRQIFWNDQDIIITLNYARSEASFDLAFIEITYTIGTIEKEDNL